MGELIKNTVKDLLGLRKMIAAVILIALPAVIALIWRAAAGHSFDAESAYNMLSAGLVFGFTLVILSVVYSTGVIGQEVGQKTIVYLLTHAVPRWRILLVKLTAALIATIVTVWIASLCLALVTFGPTHLVHSQLGRDMAILPVGALAYSALFLFLATLISRALIIGLLFAFGWESWVPNLPGDFGKVSLMAYLRVLAPHPQPQSDTVDLGSISSMLNPPTISTHLAWGVLLSVIVVSLAAALLVFSTKEYAPRDAE